MDEPKPDSEVSQALVTLGQYLDDTIAPLLASDAIELLLEHPAGLAAERIAGWVSSQYRGKGAETAAGDYLFHAAGKLHEMGRLKLVPEERLKNYLNELGPLLLGVCPAEDRENLAHMLQHLGSAPDVSSTPPGFTRRSGTRLDQAPGLGRPEQGRAVDRRFYLLWRRLDEETRGEAGTASRKSEERGELISQVLAAAAAKSKDSHEFNEVQESLKTLGIESGPEQIFRTLGASLPGWGVQVSPEFLQDKVPFKQNIIIEAMRSILRLAPNRWEGDRRFQALVQAAIEQFNSGSLARAATMFQLAGSLTSENTLSPGVCGGLRATAHQSLDVNRLRTFAEMPEKHELLGTVLNFFDQLRVDGLLQSLESEPKRDRRRLLLNLLEVQGGDARGKALAKLSSWIDDGFTGAWYFPRNLIVLLNRIPRSDAESPEAEIEMMQRLLEETLPAPLAREAITNLGRIRQESAERILIATADKLEALLMRESAGEDAAAGLKSLLDRAIFVLAHYGTPNAYRKVVAHGLLRHDALGDTLARLTYLSRQDLSLAEESVSKLLETLRSHMPRRLFGVVYQKHEPLLLALIRALSSTPTPAVFQALEDVVRRFPSEEFGVEAARILKGFASADKDVDAPAERLMGDLELFGLPDLLQQLARLGLTGTLTIRDERGETIGSLVLDRGRMQTCNAGTLAGQNAFYLLLERPVARTFLFLGRRERSRPGQAETSQSLDLAPLIREGMRRHDELKRSRALVPDAVPLRLTGREPRPRPDEEDVALFERVWTRVKSGSTAEECEAECAVDAYTVRNLLARWVEEEVLNPQ